LAHPRGDGHVGRVIAERGCHETCECRSTCNFETGGRLPSQAPESEHGRHGADAADACGLADGDAYARRRDQYARADQAGEEEDALDRVLRPEEPALNSAGDQHEDDLGLGDDEQPVAVSGGCEGPRRKRDAADHGAPGHSGPDQHKRRDIATGEGPDRCLAPRRHENGRCDLPQAEARNQRGVRAPAAVQHMRRVDRLADVQQACADDLAGRAHDEPCDRRLGEGHAQTGPDPAPEFSCIVFVFGSLGAAHRNRCDDESRDREAQRVQRQRQGWA